MRGRSYCRLYQLQRDLRALCAERLPCPGYGGALRCMSRYFGLESAAFRQDRDVDRFVATPLHEEMLSRLLFLAEQRHSFGLMTGPAGTGKSLLLDVLRTHVQPTQSVLIHVDLFGVDDHEFLWHLAAGMHLSPANGGSSFRLARMISDQLSGLKRSNVQTLILCDHLNHADPACAMQIERLLHSDQVGERRLTVIAAAESAAPFPRLGSMSHLQVELTPLDRSAMEPYIRGRLRQAGCSEELFDATAFDAILECTNGIPREINGICDLALLAAAEAEQRTIDAATIARVSSTLYRRRASLDTVIDPALLSG